MKMVLFVCTGNTCRSPMAAALANEMFSSRGMAVVAASCGIFAIDDADASKNAVLAMKDGYGCDISGHRAKIVREEDLAAAHIVIAMTSAHKGTLCAVYPNYADKVYAIGEFGGGFSDINDPFGGDLEIYVKTAGQISWSFENLSWEEYI